MATFHGCFVLPVPRTVSPGPIVNEPVEFIFTFFAAPCGLYQPLSGIDLTWLRFGLARNHCRDRYLALLFESPSTAGARDASTEQLMMRCRLFFQPHHFYSTQRQDIKLLRSLAWHENITRADPLAALLYAILSKDILGNFLFKTKNRRMFSSTALI